MKKLIVAFALASLVAGCATNPDGTSSSFFTNVQQDFTKVKTVVKAAFNPDNLDTLEAAYGTVAASAVTYRSFCERKIINKHCWITISAMQPYENKAYNALLAVRNTIKANPTADVSNALTLARQAIDAYKAYQTANGVN